MKRCPACRQTYSDDALSFCTDDGTPLVAEMNRSDDLQATIMATPPPPRPQQPAYNSTSTTQVYQGSPPSWPPSSAPYDFAPPARPKPTVAYFIIGGSLLAAAFLGFIWLVGVVAGIGGGLIHLFLLLALLIGFVGVLAGVIMLTAGKR